MDKHDILNLVDLLLMEAHKENLLNKITKQHPDIFTKKQKITAELTPEEKNSALAKWLELTRGNGYLYIIHFESPYYRAKHYTGFTYDLSQRLLKHKGNYGAKLIQHIQTTQNIKWVVSRIFPNVTFDFETYLKKVFKNIPKLCPFCPESYAYKHFGGKQDKVTQKILTKLGLSDYLKYAD